MTSANPVPNYKSDAVKVRDRAIGLVFQLYKSFLSPLLHAISPSRCLYLPTCSEYAYTAVSRFGVPRGSWMALRRLLRCHPWAKGGLDPVPENSATGVTHATRLAPSGSDRKGADHLP
jgi:hypothetical protein